MAGRCPAETNDFGIDHDRGVHTTEMIVLTLLLFVGGVGSFGGARFDQFS